MSGGHPRINAPVVAHVSNTLLGFTIECSDSGGETCSKPLNANSIAREL